MGVKGRLTGFQFAFSTPGATITAGTIAVNWYQDGGNQGTIFTASTGNNAPSFAYSARLGRQFNPASTFGIEVVVSSGFTTSVATDVTVELTWEY